MLYARGYPRSEVNALANFTFLTQETNLLVSDHDPAEYLEEFVAKHPGAVESHWIPMDRTLWKVEKYSDFLAARRQLLADAANRFLDSLLAGAVPEAEIAPSLPEAALRAVPGAVEGQEEERALQECNEWVVQQGLPEGEYMYELANSETGEPLAIFDLAWPAGLQVEYSQPVALLLDEPEETQEIANRHGYRYFTDVQAFREYVEREILAMAPVGS
jgi:hypothetical protein